MDRQIVVYGGILVIHKKKRNYVLIYTTTWAKFETTPNELSQSQNTAYGIIPLT